MSLFKQKPSEYEVLRRITRLEEKNFGKKKRAITLNQQILALHHLGMLDKIREFNIPNYKKAELLANILNGDASNTKKAIEDIPKKEKGELMNYFNYSFLSNLFEEYDLPQSVDVKNILNKIETLEK